MQYERLEKGKTPVLAVCYDFDRTLTPGDMQAQGFIQSVGADVNEFWKQSNEFAINNNMDMNLAYMLAMVKRARGKFYVTREALKSYGARIKLYEGAEGWFDRITGYGRQRGIAVEHYVISSGIKEMIEGTAVAGKFRKIYASSFAYDEYGAPEWPAQTINYTNKTQFLFRIEKGCLDINDHEGVNRFIPPEKLRVPLRNMVYIGDSDTDIPCMKLVNSSGGHAIGVYDPEGSRDKVYRLMANNRIKYYAPADYREGSRLDVLLKAIIDKTAAYERLKASTCAISNRCARQDTTIKDCAAADPAAAHILFIYPTSAAPPELPPLFCSRRRFIKPARCTNTARTGRQRCAKRTFRGVNFKHCSAAALAKRARLW